MVNAMGLPNPGAEAAAANLIARRRPGAAAREPGGRGRVRRRRGLRPPGPHADGVELNASCPNVSWGRDRDNEAHLRELVTAFVERTDRPVFVKLPPFVTPVEREVVLALARIAQEAGAQGLTLGNTRPVADPGLSVGQGGLSGLALWPQTVEVVAAVREATGAALPLNACGGVFSADDVLACLEAGAATVQIYTALIFEGPGVLGTLTRGLRDRLRARGAPAANVAGTREHA